MTLIFHLRLKISCDQASDVKVAFIGCLVNINLFPMCRFGGSLVIFLPQLKQFVTFIEIQFKI